MKIFPEWANFLVRDGDGALWIYEHEPKKKYEWWDKNDWNELAKRLDGEIFPDVKWSDDKPTEIIKIEENHTHQKSEDLVNHPDHYKQGHIETLALMKAVMSREAYLGFLQGNMIKYTIRAPFKGSKEIDYDKAKFYKDEYDKEMAE